MTLTMLGQYKLAYAAGWPEPLSLRSPGEYVAPAAADLYVRAKFSGNPNVHLMTIYDRRTDNVTRRDSAAIWHIWRGAFGLCP